MCVYTFYCVFVLCRERLQNVDDIRSNVREVIQVIYGIVCETGGDTGFCIDRHFTNAQVGSSYYIKGPEK